MPEQSGSFAEVEGVVERIVFFNEENHFCIAQIKPSKKKFSEPQITITGIMPNLECGETVLVKGQWLNHKSYGLQIKVSEFESRLPSTLYGLEKFLGSGMISGIGKEYAKRIVAHFGQDTLKVIDHDSKRLTEVGGIGAKRAKQIKASWEERRCLRDVMIFLQRYGVGVGTCLKIVRKFGMDSPSVIREEPYRIAREIDGIGFKTADKIALNSGIPNESPQRVETGILYALKEFEEEGDTRVPAGELEAKAATMLELTKERCAEAIGALLKKNEIKIVCERSIQSSSLDYCENNLAQRLEKILKTPSCLPPIKHEIALDWACKRMKVEFAPQQSQAILAALKNKAHIITGGPGTGKTTILRALCDILKAKKVKIALAAPTGRAAQRMSEATSLEAKTIHRLLGYDASKGGFARNQSSPLDADFIIIDESSMLDTRLASSILNAVPNRANLVLVGDTNQLPSVGAGNVLKDIIDSESITTTRLEKIFRQGARSQIVVASHEILNGNSSIEGLVPTSINAVKPERDIHFIEAPTPEECVDACTRLAKICIPRWYGADKISGSQILAPMHKGAAGIGALNSILQKELNPSQECASLGGTFFKEGDKIMQTRNNYDLDIFNGDMGIVKKIRKEENMMSAKFENGIVEFSRTDCADIALAYAISIHKSQGSEFPIVIIPLLKQHFVMLQRNLIYTAITRARGKVFIVGDPYAFALAVKNSRTTRRRTALKERLRWQ
ncbi:MAG: ATP-dependent RecD-like DNA helicase [Opitutales bacterium]|nr:ATP-dependent RecD-like DNA helicase [Opitutales bacterium]